MKCRKAPDNATGRTDRCPPGALRQRAAGPKIVLPNVFLERVRQQPMEDEEERDQHLRSVQNRVVELPDSWLKVIEDSRSAGVEVQYQR